MVNTGFKKVICTAITIVFVVTSVFSPGNLSAQPIQTSLPLMNIDVNKIIVNSGVASLEERFVAPEGPRGRTVIAIQNAHGIYDAQENIRALIQELQDKYNFNLVGLEGGAGKSDHTFLRTFPDKEVNRKVAESYMRRAELSGGEAAAILNPKPGIFYGVENPELYYVNRNSFLKAQGLKESNLHAINLFEKKLDKQREKIFPLELLEFHKAEQKYLSGQMPLWEFINLLGGYNLSEQYPGVLAIYAAIAKARKAGQKSEEAKQAEEAAAKVEGRVLFEEIKNLSAAIEDHLSFRRRPESRGIQELLAQYHELRILRNLVSLELSRAEYEEFVGAGLDPARGRPQGSPLQNLNLAPALQFYADAVKRDEAMYQNLLKDMKHENQNISIIVAGGFHTSGFAERLKKDGISFAVYSPRIHDMPKENKYLDVMEGKASYVSTIESPLPTMGLNKDGEAFVDNYAKDGIRLKQQAGANLSELERNWRDDIIRTEKAQNTLADPSPLIRRLEKIFRSFLTRASQILAELKEKYLAATKTEAKKRVDEFVASERKRLEAVPAKAASLGREQLIDEIVEMSKGINTFTVQHEEQFGIGFEKIGEKPEFRETLKNFQVLSMGSGGIRHAEMIMMNAGVGRLDSIGILQETPDRQFQRTMFNEDYEQLSGRKNYSHNDIRYDQYFKTAAPETVDMAITFAGLEIHGVPPESLQDGKSREDVVFETYRSLHSVLKPGGIILNFGLIPQDLFPGGLKKKVEALGFDIQIAGRKGSIAILRKKANVQVPAMGKSLGSVKIADNETSKRLMEAVTNALRDPEQSILVETVFDPAGTVKAGKKKLYDYKALDSKWFRIVKMDADGKMKGNITHLVLNDQGEAYVMQIDSIYAGTQQKGTNLRINPQSAGELLLPVLDILEEKLREGKIIGPTAAKKLNLPEEGRPIDEFLRYFRSKISPAPLPIVAPEAAKGASLGAYHVPEEVPGVDADIEPLTSPLTQRALAIFKDAFQKENFPRDLKKLFEKDYLEKKYKGPRYVGYDLNSWIVDLETDKVSGKIFIDVYPDDETASLVFNFDGAQSQTYLIRLKDRGMEDVIRGYIKMFFDHFIPGKQMVLLPQVAAPQPADPHAHEESIRAASLGASDVDAFAQKLADMNSSVWIGDAAWNRLRELNEDSEINLIKILGTEAEVKENLKKELKSLPKNQRAVLILDITYGLSRLVEHWVVADRAEVLLENMDDYVKRGPPKKNYDYLLYLSAFPPAAKELSPNFNLHNVHFGRNMDHDSDKGVVAIYDTFDAVSAGLAKEFSNFTISGIPQIRLQAAWEDLAALRPYLGFTVDPVIISNHPDHLMMEFHDPELLEESPEVSKLFQISMRTNEGETGTVLLGEGKMSLLKSKSVNKEDVKAHLNAWFLKQVFPWLKSRGFKRVIVLPFEEKSRAYFGSLGFKKNNLSGFWELDLTAQGASLGAEAKPEHGPAGEDEIYALMPEDYLLQAGLFSEKTMSLRTLENELRIRGVKMDSSVKYLIGKIRFYQTPENPGIPNYQLDVLASLLMKDPETKTYRIFTLLQKLGLSSGDVKSINLSSLGVFSQYDVGRGKGKNANVARVMIETVDGKPYDFAAVVNLEHRQRDWTDELKSLKSWLKRERVDEFEGMRSLATYLQFLALEQDYPKTDLLPKPYLIVPFENTVILFKEYIAGTDLEDWFRKVHNSIAAKEPAKRKPPKRLVEEILYKTGRVFGEMYLKTGGWMADMHFGNIIANTGKDLKIRLRVADYMGVEIAQDDIASGFYHLLRGREDARNAFQAVYNLEESDEKPTLDMDYYYYLLAGFESVFASREEANRFFDSISGWLKRKEDNLPYQTLEDYRKNRETVKPDPSWETAPIKAASLGSFTVDDAYDLLDAADIPKNFDLSRVKWKTIVDEFASHREQKEALMQYIRDLDLLIKEGKYAPAPEQMWVDELVRKYFPDVLRRDWAATGWKRFISSPKPPKDQQIKISMLKVMLNRLRVFMEPPLPSSAELPAIKPATQRLTAARPAADISVQDTVPVGASAANFTEPIPVGVVAEMITRLTDERMLEAGKGMNDQAALTARTLVLKSYSGNRISAEKIARDVNKFPTPSLTDLRDQFRKKEAEDSQGTFGHALKFELAVEMRKYLESRGASLGAELQKIKKSLSPQFSVLIDELAQPAALGEEAVIQGYRKDFNQFESALRRILERKNEFDLTFQALAAPDSIGLETLREIFRENPNRFSESVFLMTNRLNFLTAIFKGHDFRASAIRKAFANDPDEFSRAIEIFDREHFDTVFNPLAASGIPTESLENLLIASPMQLLDALRLVRNHLKDLAAYVDPKTREIDVKRLLKEKNMKLYFILSEGASMNAAERLIEDLELGPENAVISSQVSEKTVQERFGVKGFEVKKIQDFDGVLPIQFHDGLFMSHLGKDKIVEMPYEPFKYVLRGRAPPSASEKIRMRMGMKLPRERKVVVVSVLNQKTAELQAIIDAYLKIPRGPERPLLILGLREPDTDRSIEVSLRKQGLRVLERHDRTEDFARCAANDVLILNTSGELAGLFRAADLAIIGSNRNLLEPVSQSVPVLYFQGQWTGNELIKNLIERFFAARTVMPASLQNQIKETLEYAEPMRRAEEKVTASVRDSLLPAGKLYARLAIAAAVLDRVSARSLGGLSDKMPTFEELVPQINLGDGMAADYLPGLIQQEGLEALLGKTNAIKDKSIAEKIRRILFIQSRDIKASGVFAGAIVSIRPNEKEIEAMQKKIFAYGEANKIMAHGVEARKMGLASTIGIRNLLNIILEGSVNSQISAGSPFFGTLGGSNATFDAGPHGPFYVVMDPRYPTFRWSDQSAHAWYLVPEEADKKFLVSAIEDAAKPEWNVMNPDVARWYATKVVTYEEYLKANAASLGEAAPYRFPDQLPDGYALDLRKRLKAAVDILFQKYQGLKEQHFLDVLSVLEDKYPELFLEASEWFGQSDGDRSGLARYLSLLYREPKKPRLEYTNPESLEDLAKRMESTPGRWLIVIDGFPGAGKSKFFNAIQNRELPISEFFEEMEFVEGDTQVDTWMRQILADPELPASIRGNRENDPKVLDEWAEKMEKKHPRPFGLEGPRFQQVRRMFDRTGGSLAQYKRFLADTHSRIVVFNMVGSFDVLVKEIEPDQKFPAFNVAKINIVPESGNYGDRLPRRLAISYTVVGEISDARKKELSPKINELFGLLFAMAPPKIYNFQVTEADLLDQLQSLRVERRNSRTTSINPVDMAIVDAFRQAGLTDPEKFTDAESVYIVRMAAKNFRDVTGYSLGNQMPQENVDPLAIDLNTLKRTPQLSLSVDVAKMTQEIVNRRRKPLDNELTKRLNALKEAENWKCDPENIPNEKVSAIKLGFKLLISDAEGGDYSISDIDRMAIARLVTRTYVRAVFGDEPQTAELLSRAEDHFLNSKPYLDYLKRQEAQHVIDVMLQAYALLQLAISNQDFELAGEIKNELSKITPEQLELPDVAPRYQQLKELLETMKMTLPLKPIAPAAPFRDEEKGKSATRGASLGDARLRDLERASRRAPEDIQARARWLNDLIERTGSDAAELIVIARNNPEYISYGAGDETTRQVLLEFARRLEHEINEGNFALIDGTLPYLADLEAYPAYQPAVREIRGRILSNPGVQDWVDHFEADMHQEMTKYFQQNQIGNDQIEGAIYINRETLDVKIDYRATPIPNLNFLSGSDRMLSHLTEISVPDSRLADISVLSRAPNLKVIDVRGTRISDVSPLTHLTKLQQLHVDRTPDLDLRPLRQMRGLKIYRGGGVPELATAASLGGGEERLSADQELRSLLKEFIEHPDSADPRKQQRMLRLIDSLPREIFESVFQGIRDQLNASIEVANRPLPASPSEPQGFAARLLKRATERWTKKSQEEAQQKKLGDLQKELKALNAFQGGLYDIPPAGLGDSRELRPGEKFEFGDFSSYGHIVTELWGPVAGQGWIASLGDVLFIGHQGIVTDAHFSPDGRRIVTVSQDETARVWDSETGRELAVLHPTSWDVRRDDANFTSDGSRIIVAGQVWDLALRRDLPPPAQVPAGGASLGEAEKKPSLKRHALVASLLVAGSMAIPAIAIGPEKAFAILRLKVTGLLGDSRRIEALKALSEIDPDRAAMEALEILNSSEISAEMAEASLSVVQKGNPRTILNLFLDRMPMFENPVNPKLRDLSFRGLDSVTATFLVDKAVREGDQAFLYEILSNPRLQNLDPWTSAQIRTLVLPGLGYSNFQGDVGFVPDKTSGVMLTNDSEVHLILHNLHFLKGNTFDPRRRASFDNMIKIIAKLDEKFRRSLDVMVQNKDAAAIRALQEMMKSISQSMNLLIQSVQVIPTDVIRMSELESENEIIKKLSDDIKTALERVEGKSLGVMKVEVSTPPAPPLDDNELHYLAFKLGFVKFAGNQDEFEKRVRAKISAENIRAIGDQLYEYILKTSVEEFEAQHAEIEDFIRSLQKSTDQELVQRTEAVVDRLLSSMSDSVKAALKPELIKSFTSTLREVSKRVTMAEMGVAQTGEAEKLYQAATLTNEDQAKMKAAETILMKRLREATSKLIKPNEKTVIVTHPLSLPKTREEIAGMFQSAFAAVPNDPLLDLPLLKIYVIVTDENGRAVRDYAAQSPFAANIEVKRAAPADLARVFEGYEKRAKTDNVIFLLPNAKLAARESRVIQHEDSSVPENLSFVKDALAEAAVGLARVLKLPEENNERKEYLAFLSAEMGITYKQDPESRKIIISLDLKAFVQHLVEIARAQRITAIAA